MKHRTTLTRDYSKCAPGIQAQAEVALAVHRLADVFYVVAESLALSSRAQAAATEVFGRHLEVLGATLSSAVASNAGHSAELSRHLDQVDRFRAELEAASGELAKTKDALRYAHRRIEQLQAETEKQPEIQPEKAPARKSRRTKRKAQPAPKEPEIQPEDIDHPMHEDIDCATFDGREIDPEIRARMDADRAAAEAEADKEEADHV